MFCLYNIIDIIKVKFFIDINLVYKNNFRCFVLSGNNLVLEIIYLVIDMFWVFLGEYIVFIGLIF